MAELKLFRRGKVRDVYDLGDKLLMVSTDRLSAFDHILPTLVPDKGKILTAISAFWFANTRKIVPNHMISTVWGEISRAAPQADKAWAGRAMLVKKAERVDVECVVRGYLAGSAWREYKASGTVCGHTLPAGLKEAGKLPEPIFTPATKADEGHDENITRERFKDLVGRETAQKLEETSLKLYRHATEQLVTRGLILADTKFEFGFLDGKLIAIDEMITPDSSRFWDLGTYKPGVMPDNFDKQYVRDYLEKIRWNKNPPVPALPAEVASQTASLYREALRRITE